MSDSEYEEEEFLVFADFKNQLLPKELDDEKTRIKIIGVDTQNPIAEINGNVFKGTYDYAMGTNVFFQKDEDSQPVQDPLFDVSCKQNYKYCGKTNKIIAFQRIYVDEIRSEKMDIPAENSEPEESLKLTMTYDEAIKQFPMSTDGK